MGWTDDHLHQFMIRGQRYGESREGALQFSTAATALTLSAFALREHEAFFYVYDSRRSMATFTLNPVKLTPARCPTISGDDLLLCGRLLTHATGFVAQELLVIVQIAVEGLDAALGDQPKLVTYGAQQGSVVTDQHHCAFEFVERHA